VSFKIKLRQPKNNKKEIIMKITERVVELSNKELIHRASSIGQTKPFKDASDRYSFIPTIKAVDWLRDAGWKPIMAGQSGVRDSERDGYQKHMIRFTRPDLVRDGHRADILLYNSHDVSATFKLLGGFYRFVCSNGLVIGDEFAEFSHKHQNFCIDDFVEDGKKMNETLEVAGGLVQDWKTLELTKDEQGVYAAASLELLYKDGASIEPKQLLEVRRQEDAQTDLWHTYNTVQENLIKGGLRGKSSSGRATQTREIVSLDRSRNINQTLWQISSNMNKLKAA
jgi:hypothetical protein